MVKHNIIDDYNLFLQNHGDIVEVDNDQTVSMESTIREAVKYSYLRDSVRKGIQKKIEELGNQIAMLRQEHEKYIVTPGVVAENYAENNMRATELLNDEKRNIRVSNEIKDILLDPAKLNKEIPGLNIQYEEYQNAFKRVVESAFRTLEGTGIENFISIDSIDKDKVVESPTGQEVNLEVLRFIDDFYDNKDDVATLCINNLRPIEILNGLRNQLHDYKKIYDYLALCTYEAPDNVFDEDVIEDDYKKSMQYTIKSYILKMKELSKKGNTLGDRKKIEEKIEYNEFLISSMLFGGQVEIAANRPRITSLQQENKKLKGELENYSPELVELEEKIKEAGLAPVMDCYFNMDKYQKGSPESQVCNILKKEYDKSHTNLESFITTVNNNIAILDNKYAAAVDTFKNKTGIPEVAKNNYDGVVSLIKYRDNYDVKKAVDVIRLLSTPIEMDISSMLEFVDDTYIFEEMDAQIENMVEDFILKHKVESETMNPNDIHLYEGEDEEYFPAGRAV